jgi:hypothetical protein
MKADIERGARVGGAGVEGARAAEFLEEDIWLI